jgi:hypothetical protein
MVKFWVELKNINSLGCIGFTRVMAKIGELAGECHNDKESRKYSDNMELMAIIQ